MQIAKDIDRLLRAAIDARQIPGAVAMAATGGDVIYRGAFGARDASGDMAMTEDSVFWIASMTKAITTTAAMQLVEQGRLSLDGPIGAVLPDLAAPLVLEGFDADGAPLLRPARTTMTLRHLLTHTSGFCYDMMNANMVRYLKETGAPRVSSGKHAALQMPLAFDPGTRWEYGISTDLVGRAIEVVSGQRLDGYLRDHVFAPLGMIDTGFVPGQARRDRRVGMHVRNPDGSLKEVAFETEQAPEQHSGGGGLYSTAPDYIRFMQMILNKGRGNGHQVLSPETVADMGANHIGHLDVTPMPSAIPALTNHVELFPAQRKTWGLGFMINTALTPEGRSIGSLAWAGLANTYYWIDPARDICGVILMQVMPFGDAICMDAFAEFERGVYAGLDAAQRPDQRKSGYR